MQEIWEALEASTPVRGGLVDPRANASKRDVLIQRDSLMRFLSELDAGLSVGELREALEEYQ